MYYICDIYFVDLNKSLKDFINATAGNLKLKESDKTFSGQGFCSIVKLKSAPSKNLAEKILLENLERLLKIVSRPSSKVKVNYNGQEMDGEGVAYFFEINEHEVAVSLEKTNIIEISNSSPKKFLTHKYQQIREYARQILKINE